MWQESGRCMSDIYAVVVYLRTSPDTEAVMTNDLAAALLGQMLSSPDGPPISLAGLDVLDVRPMSDISLG